MTHFQVGLHTTTFYTAENIQIQDFNFPPEQDKGFVFSSGAGYRCADRGPRAVLEPPVETQDREQAKEEVKGI